ncbi:hypothetical protein [Paenilisteria rocourtiae]|uniref:Uncharacterized protein n=1 Tax=Listeria rocourtiae TaxID=647910 RepID=A0A4R6ZJI3_9LIST|nr:hypothetical protein [Listeria rocourtiae]EUJ47371.1 hypothetical protein PROCOU_09761 [Listeria rocourtiae FSL F6-920]TDR52194.1 hypothetical protein DFP96_10984 [Listeria rocourtiae]
MGKKVKGIIAIAACLLIAGAGFVIYKTVKDNNVTRVQVVKEKDRTRFIGEDGVSFYSTVDTRDKIYTLIDAEGDTDSYNIAKAVYAIDKKSGEIEIVPGTEKRKFGMGGISETFGNEAYLGWVESDADYETRTMVYDIEQEKVVKKWHGDDWNSYFDFHVIGHRLYRLESHGKVDRIKSYDLKTGEEQQIDEIGAKGTVLAFSEHKMWYRDTRQGKGHLKGYDLRNGNYEIHNLGVAYSNLKPINEHLLAYFKDGTTEGLYLYDTQLKKSVLLNEKDAGIKASYDGKGLLISDQLSYKIDSLERIQYDNTIESEYPDNHRFSTAERIPSLLFITDVGEHEEIVLMNQDVLRWSEK